MGRRREGCSSEDGGGGRPGSRERVSRSSSRRSSELRRTEKPSSPSMRRTCSRSSTTARRGQPESRDRSACGRSGSSLWLGPLYNNLGWSHSTTAWGAGALEAFELALAAREQDDSRPHEIEIARYTVGKALRALDRVDEAAAARERCVLRGPTRQAWTTPTSTKSWPRTMPRSTPRRRGARAGPRGPRGHRRGESPRVRRLRQSSPMLVKKPVRLFGRGKSSSS